MGNIVNLWRRLLLKNRCLKNQDTNHSEAKKVDLKCRQHFWEAVHENQIWEGNITKQEQRKIGSAGLEKKQYYY